MTPAGRVFENSLEKQPFDIRVGAGQVLPGLDEGLLSMKVRTRASTSGVENA
jgi:peptidylprolyl isomerase